MAENVLPFTDEVIVVLVQKYSQQLQLLALNLENGFGVYVRKSGDLIGDNSLTC